MDQVAELEKIRLFNASSKQRIRRLDVLLEEQIRILDLDPTLHGLFERPAGHLITMLELRIFAAGFLVAALGAFLIGYWAAQML